MKVAMLVYGEVDAPGTDAATACDDLEQTIEGVLPEIVMNEDDQVVGTVKWGGVTIREVT